jgi:hypothetical protein
LVYCRPNWLHRYCHAPGLGGYVALECHFAIGHRRRQRHQLLASAWLIGIDSNPFRRYWRGTKKRALGPQREIVWQRSREYARSLDANERRRTRTTKRRMAGAVPETRQQLNPPFILFHFEHGQYPKKILPIFFSKKHNGFKVIIDRLRLPYYTVHY